MTTTPGAYSISFWLYSTPAGGNEFDVEFNGVTLFDQSEPGPFGYTEFNLLGTATGTSTPLTFSALNRFGTFPLDDVVLARLPGSAVPEPASLVLLATGLLGTAVLWRRRA